MTPEERSKLAVAVPKMKIIDVILASCSFSRPAEDASESAQAWQQHKRGVRYQVESTSEGVQELHVLVELGTRVLFSDAEDGKTGAVQFEIEADFLVRYVFDEALDDDAVSAFANFNSVHNVWPFWRQHVFDIAQRGRLPMLEIPLFSGVRG